MSNDCGNDCTTPIDFPRRPENRPGLAHIDYRIGAYSDFRAALLRGLDMSENLHSWTYRGSDDPGIALLEGAAILGDILAFYQETYANEAFLRTARWRESIADLVRLLGYRLSPGLAGGGTFAFEIKGDAPVVVPAGFPLKAQLEGMPKQVELETSAEITAAPWLNAFNLYRPQAAADIGAATTELYISEPDQYVPTVTLKPGDRLLVGEADNAASPTKLANSEIVIVDSVRVEHGVRIYRIKGAMKRTTGVASLAAYRLGRTFRHFGHAASPTVTVTPSSVEATATSNTSGSKTTTTTSVALPSQKAVTFMRDVGGGITKGSWTFYRFDGETRLVLNPTLSYVQFPLDAEVNDLANGSGLVLQTPIVPSNGAVPTDQVFIRKVASSASETVTWGSSTGKSTIVTLDAGLMPGVSGGLNYYDIRQIQIHEVLGSKLVLRAARQETAAASGNDLYFYGTDAQARLMQGRRLMLVPPAPAQGAAQTAAPRIVAVTAVEQLQAQVADRLLLRKVTVNEPVTYADFSNTSPTVMVHGNLADATQGKTEVEAPLGNGDARQAFQTFKLPKGPLTYLVSAGEAPPEAPELEIWVAGRLWKRVPSFFGRGYDEEIYIVREDEENQSWVQFGDGKTGARLPSGVKNVVARYRTGTGAFGALKAGTTVQPGARLERLDKVRLPGIVAGGSEPEDGDNARDAAPGKFQSLDRLVTLRDFESETLAISGVARATATWRVVDGAPAVVLTVLMRTGRGAEIQSVRDVVASYNRCRGANRHRVVVKEGLLRFVLAGVTVAVDPTFRREDVEARILEALGVTAGVSDTGRSVGMFSIRSRRFGEAEYAASVEGAIQRVEGVMWARATTFGSIGTAYDPATLDPASVPAALEPAVECGPHEMLALYRGHLTITCAAVAAGEGC